MVKYLTLSLFLSFFTFFKSYAQDLDTLIRVDNHQLHFKIIQGTGLPILFESGNGDDGTVWEEILKPLQKVTGATLITYDRAGLGKSSIDTTKISFKKEIQNLEYALDQLGYSEEIFIVCHSFGGFYSTLFSRRNKKKVKGIVLIDVARPCFTTKEWSKNFTDAISDEDWKMIKEYKLGLYYVLKDLAGISNYMSKKSLPKKIPATLIAAEKIMPMVKKEEKESWKACLEAFGTPTNHRYVLAKEAGHKVWKDDATLVIREIMILYKSVIISNKSR